MVKYPILWLHLCILQKICTLILGVSRKTTPEVTPENPISHTKGVFLKGPRLCHRTNGKKFPWCFGGSQKECCLSLWLMSCLLGEWKTLLFGHNWHASRSSPSSWISKVWVVEEMPCNKKTERREDVVSSNTASVLILAVGPCESHTF